MICMRILPLFLTAILIVNGCGYKTESASKIDRTERLSGANREKRSGPIDTLAYRSRLHALANGDTSGLWPARIGSYPLPGAILPFRRIVAYYGNLYSKRMGILGEYPPDEVWKRLHAEVRAWELADPSTPVQPAIHYIAVVAQGIPTKNGKYCMRMPNAQIDSALAIAKMGNAIVFLDVQVAQSDLQTEVPLLEKYLKLPQVHLAIDPEFSMREGKIPGKKIGTLDAEDVNFCSEYLSRLVREHALSPKILIVHRFTQGMVTNYKNIAVRPEVQVVMHMDGWGEPVLKRSTYSDYIYRQPVQFTGFKLFYKNDIKKNPHRMMTPPELIRLKPRPIYIQYQ